MTPSASILLPAHSGSFGPRSFNRSLNEVTAIRPPAAATLRFTRSGKSVPDNVQFSEQEVALAIALSQVSFEEEKTVRDELEAAIQLSLRESRMSSRTTSSSSNLRPASEYRNYPKPPHDSLHQRNAIKSSSPRSPVAHDPRPDVIDTQASTSSSVQEEGSERSPKNCGNDIEALSCPEPGAGPTVSLAASPDDLLLYFQRLVTQHRSCSRCHASLMQPHGPVYPISAATPTSSLLAVLHLYCSACDTSHCRGCSKPTSCPANCRGGEACPVNRCCAAGRTIGVYETLALFDRDLLAQARRCGGAVGKEPVDDTNGRMPTNVAANARWEASALHAFRNINSLLSRNSSLDASLDDPSLELIKTILLMSTLPNAIRHLLAKPDIGYWISRSELYSALLETLKAFVECRLDDLLCESLCIVDISRTSGLSGWMWENGEIAWIQESSLISHKKTLASSAQSVPLQASIRLLEPRIRQPLLACAAKIQFQPTLEKVHGLCDGILYLILRQIVGADS